MATPRVARGRRTEAAVAAYLAQHGWPHAERVPASLPGSDITGTPDIAVEIKARSDFHPRAWLAQAQKSADGRLPVAVVRSNGQGEQAGDYLAMVTFADLVGLLLEAGYGDKSVAPRSCECGRRPDPGLCPCAKPGTSHCACVHDDNPVAS